MKLYLPILLVILGDITCVGCISFSINGLIIGLSSKFAQLIGLPEPIPEIVEEAFLEPTELIKRAGYPAENQTLITKDGYILTHHRIPYGKNIKTNETAIPVLLVHGMNCESTQWFNNGPESLAFVLADEGYDVWLANVRGTTFSSHVKLTRNDDQFWNYNLGDMSQNDLKPLIDYILNTTGFSKLLYIGQSLGTTLSAYTLADNPEYNKKIAGNIYLAPVGIFKYATFMYRPVLQYHKLIRFISSKLGIHAWFSVSDLVRKLEMIFCPSGKPTLCELSMSLIAGYNPYIRNTTRVPIYCNHCSSGASLNMLTYMGQVMYGDVTRQYDYGKEENLRKYNSEIPPKIDSKFITSPIVLIYGANDVLATPLNVELTKRNLSSVIDTYLIPNPMAMHSDFMYAKHGREFLYDKIINYLKKLW